MRDCFSHWIAMSLNTVILLIAFVVAAHGLTLNPLFSRKNSPVEDSTSLGVYDGSKTSIKDHPHIGALLVRGSYFCQCTIVSDQWCVTTGDCVYGLSSSDLSIVAGSEDGLTGDKFSVVKVVTHPKYGTSTFDYEFACVQIKGKFKWSDKVKAIMLPNKEVKPKTDMVVAGWGSTESLEADEDPNNTLLQGNMEWLDKKECAKTYKDLGVDWTDRMACTYNKGKTTLCSGDWADAFVNNGTLYGTFVAGATSGWCSSHALPLLLADMRSVVPWIKKTTGAKYEDE